METVTETATFEASSDRLRDAITDIGPFMRAAEFDEVTVEGDIVRITEDQGECLIL